MQIYAHNATREMSYQEAIRRFKRVRLQVLVLLRLCC